VFCDVGAVKILENIGIVMIVLAVDWIAITGMAARLSGFDYRYWPPTRARSISVSFLALTVVVLGVFANPDNPPLWLLIPGFIVIIAWIVIGYRDILRQQCTGYRVPPSYCERES
jgi:amino acid transporter